MILVLGLNPAIDRYAETDSFYFEEPIRLDSIEDQAGGKGTNVSRELKRLNTPHILLTLAGPSPRDPFDQLLQQEDLPVRVLPLSASPRLNQTIRFRDTGSILKLNTPGPTLEHNQWLALKEQLRTLGRDTEWLMLSGSIAPGIPPEELVRELENLPSTCRIVADTTPGMVRLLLEKGKLYSLLPNRSEAEELAGQKLDTADAMRHFLIKLKRHVEIPLVTDGAQGVWYLDESDDIQRLGAPVVRVVSSVGAGDAFAAGWLTGLSRGWTMQQCLELALRLGSEACTRKGN